MKKKLGIVALTALVVGGIVGGGIFSLPQNMAEGAGAGAILIAWVIAFVGMLSLTKVFQWLSLNHPKITDGVYGYARNGFGDYMGFNAAWGYWLSAWIGSTSYLVVMFSALGSFNVFAFFGDGTTLAALIGQLVVLWIVHFFVLKGVREAAILNIFITCMKIIPLGLFIICVALAFKFDTFSHNFWGDAELGSLSQQIKAPMLYTVWVFLGIESATVYANRARNLTDVSKATLFGFIITIILLSCVSLLSLGVIPQHELAQMKNPSMAGVLRVVIGDVGAAFVNISLIISLSGGLLAWTLLSTEMLYLSSRGEKHTTPKIFGQLNQADTPAPALWLTNSLISLCLLVNYFNSAGYNMLIQLATSMVLIPYLLSAAFSFKSARNSKQKNKLAVSFSAIATIYSCWLIYAAGEKFLLLSLILYSVGILFYMKACRERGLQPFPTLKAKYLVLFVVAGGVVSIILLTGGVIAI